MRGDNKTQVVVATLSLVGVLGGALFANWDKIVAKDEPKSPQASSAPAPTTTQTSTGSNNVQISGSNNVVNPPPQPKPCRDKSHGVERFARTFVAERTSNWMGGGYSQDPWCNDVINELRAQHPDGEFNVLAKSEKSETKCAPFNCPQYQYYCKVEAKVEPVYVEKLSSACR